MSVLGLNDPGSNAQGDELQGNPPMGEDPQCYMGGSPPVAPVEKVNAPDIGQNWPT